MASANSADARLSKDSIASERRPTEPVTHQASVFIAIATTAAATERRSSVRTCITAADSTQRDAGELALADLHHER
ncbi:MAG: hypothetical protein ABI460_10260, partial [Caldimonas sp.]